MIINVSIFFDNLYLYVALLLFNCGIYSEPSRIRNPILNNFNITVFNYCIAKVNFYIFVIIVSVNFKENAVNGDVSGGKVGKESKENSQERETVVSNETGEKEPSPTKETAPKAESPAREATPTKEEVVEDNIEQNKENNEAKAESPAKETTPEKEKSPQRQKSIDKEPSPVREDEEKAQNSHETEETVNGAVRSREQSEDIEVDEEQTGKSERKVDDPSIALIQSEAAAAAE